MCCSKSPLRYFDGQKDPEILFEGSSKLHKKICVVRNSYKKVLQLFFDNKLASSMNMADGSPTSSIYYYYFLAKCIHPRLQNGLFIGGGAFCQASYLFNHDSALFIDVVEKDPALYPVATQFFSAPPQQKRFRVYIKDGLSYLLIKKFKYDFVFVDIGWAVNDGVSNTQNKYILNCLRYSNKRLGNHGIFTANFITSLVGNSTIFFDYIKRLRMLYRNVYVFADFPNDLKKVQDVVVFCLNTNIPQLPARCVNNSTIPKDKWPLISGLLDRLVFVNQFVPVE